MASETIGKTFGVAAGVCIVCSVLVSTASVSLRERQNLNRIRDKNKNILIAAGLIEQGERVDPKAMDALFEQKIDERWVNLDTGDFVEEADVKAADCTDEKKAAKSRDPKCSKPLDKKTDLAKLQRRAIYRRVYITPKQGDVERLILPVHGKGLWSTMYGFLALDRDLRTVRKIAFYEHGETPGLGGEIENPRWQQSWVGKTAYDEEGQKVIIDVVKGTADPDSDIEVDGLSGATLTARGVENLVRFWLGDEGYGDFINKHRQTLQ